MNSTDIEKTLQKILEIDQAAIDLEKEVKELRIESEKKLKKELRELDLKLMKKARKLGKVEREIILTETEEEIEKIRQESESICQQMKKVSDHHVEELVDDVFQELIGKRLKARG